MDESRLANSFSLYKFPITSVFGFKVYFYPNKIVSKRKHEDKQGRNSLPILPTIKIEKWGKIIEILKVFAIFLSTIHYKFELCLPWNFHRITRLKIRSCFVTSTRLKSGWASFFSYKHLWWEEFYDKLEPTFTGVEFANELFNVFNLFWCFLCAFHAQAWK